MLLLLLLLLDKQGMLHQCLGSDARRQPHAGGARGDRCQAARRGRQRRPTQHLSLGLRLLLLRLLLLRLLLLRLLLLLCLLLPLQLLVIHECRCHRLLLLVLLLLGCRDLMLSCLLLPLHSSLLRGGSLLLSSSEDRRECGHAGAALLHLLGCDLHDMLLQLLLLLLLVQHGSRASSDASSGLHGRGSSPRRLHRLWRLLHQLLPRQLLLPLLLPQPLRIALPLGQLHLVLLLLLGHLLLGEAAELLLLLPLLSLILSRLLRSLLLPRGLTLFPTPCCLHLLLLVLLNPYPGLGPQHRRILGRHLDRLLLAAILAAPQNTEHSTNQQTRKSVQELGAGGWWLQRSAARQHAGWSCRCL